jgi:hypothetical protein
MNRYGDPHKGLLKAIIDKFRELNPRFARTSVFITRALRDDGQWAGKRADTPERTVNSYLTQNPHIFRKSGPDMYMLDAAWR